MMFNVCRFRTRTCRLIRGLRALLLGLIIPALIMPTVLAAEQQDSLNVLSFNIRYNNPKDGPNAWPLRKQHVAALIRFHQADIVGLQEALLGQLKELDQALPGYRWFGVGRDDGKHAGEHTAIVYRVDRVELVNQGTFWCSPTPDIPSKGWDADLNRTATWGRFRFKQSKRELLVLNTHFDHRGALAREQCAKIIRQKVDELVGKSALGVVITGDFNTPPDSKPYRILTNNEHYTTPFYDAATVSRAGRYGSTGTFTGFDITATSEQPIDFIFVNNKLSVSRFGVLSDSFDGRLPSDHYPVLVDLTVK